MDKYFIEGYVITIAPLYVCTDQVYFKLIPFSISRLEHAKDVLEKHVVDLKLALEQVKQMTEEQLTSHK